MGLVYVQSASMLYILPQPHYPLRLPPHTRRCGYIQKGVPYIFRGKKVAEGYSQVRAQEGLKRFYKRVLALVRSFDIEVTEASFLKAFTPQKAHHEATILDFPLFYEDRFWREYCMTAYARLS